MRHSPPGTPMATAAFLTVLLAWPAVAAAQVEGAAPIAHEATPSTAVDAPAPFPAAAAVPVEPAAKPWLALTGLARATVQKTSAFAVDTSGLQSPDRRQVATRSTLRLDLDSDKHLGSLVVQGRAGLDHAVGTVAGRPRVAGDKLPGAQYRDWAATDLWLGAGLANLFGVRAGLMGSQWALGLVANDGNGALDERRDDWFSLQTTGDRVLRAQVYATPWRSDPESPLRGLLLTAAMDRVVEDETARLRGTKPFASEGLDEVADQAVVAARFYLRKDRWAGLYYVYRDQQHDDGKFLKVHVIDAALDLRLDDGGDVGNGAGSGPTASVAAAGSGGALRLQAEAALIVGHSNLAPSPDFPEHDVRQAGALARLRYDLGDSPLRIELDAGWTSGDGAMDDGSLTTFKADPNVQQGLVLFRQVLGWQSGRARVTASNPDVVGRPNEDLDRLATGGAVTSSITVFPKVGVRLADALDLYGGVLLAYAPTPPLDPFHTRTLGGGEPRNFSGQAPDGSLLGSEIDLGLRGRLALPMLPADLELCGEYGVLVPGGALAGLDGPIHSGRVTLSVIPHVEEARR